MTWQTPQPGEVNLYTSPWVQGTRAAAYFGPIKAEVFLADGAREDRTDAWEKAELELLGSLRDKARSVGANAVVGMEVSLNPFFQPEGSDRTGLHLHAIGTAARLEPEIYSSTRLPRTAIVPLTAEEEPW